MEHAGIKLYFSIVLKRFWIIILVIALFVSVTAVIMANIPKTYEAKTVIYVGKQLDGSKSIELQDMFFTQMLLRDYMALLRTNSVMYDVAEDFKKQFQQYKTATKYDVWKKISIRSEYDSMFLRISVTDSDPKVAEFLAKKVVEVFTEKVETIINNHNIDVVDSAEVKELYGSSSVASIMVTVFILGIIAGLMTVSLVEYLDNTFKSPEDVNRHLGIEVLCLVPKEQKPVLDKLAGEIFAGMNEKPAAYNRFKLLEE